MQKALRSEFPDTTILVVAHRIATIKDLDHIIVLEKSVNLSLVGTG